MPAKERAIKSDWPEWTRCATKTSITATFRNSAKRSSRSPWSLGNGFGQRLEPDRRLRVALAPHDGRGDPRNRLVRLLALFSGAFFGDSGVASTNLTHSAPAMRAARCPPVSKSCLMPTSTSVSVPTSVERGPTDASMVG